MKLLQRYILLELLRVFVLLVVVLTSMLVFVGVMREATERGLAMNKIIQIIPFVVPSMLPFTIPATLLLAVTVVYGRVAGDLEVVALKAAGVSPIRLLTPAFALGLILAFASFCLTNSTTPWAIARMEKIVAQAAEDIFLDVLSSQHFISRPEKGYSITVQKVENRELINPTFRYRKGDHKQITVNADRARIKFDLKEREVIVWLLNPRGSSPGDNASFSFDHDELTLPMDDDISSGKPRHLTINHIRDKMDEHNRDAALNDLQRNQEVAKLMLTGEFEKLGEEKMTTYAGYRSYSEHRNRKLNTEIHSRYAMAGSCFFFAFLGGPFAIMQARRQFITSFIMCFLPILLVYYPVTFLMVNLGKSAKVDPAWAMWVPNAVLAMAAFYVLRKVIQH